MGGERVFIERGGLRRGLHPAIGNVAQRGDPLGQQVDEFLHFAMHGVEQAMQLQEMAPAHVPVRLLGLGLKVQRIGQARLEQRHRCLAHVGGQIDAGFVGHRLKP
jgi:hypothetical protein